MQGDLLQLRGIERQAVLFTSDPERGRMGRLRSLGPHLSHSRRIWDGDGTGDFMEAGLF